MTITIIGTGYVGLTTGICLAYIGHDVFCVDSDRKKIADLKNGAVPIYEPFLEDLLQDASKRICFTTSYEESVPNSDIVFVAVGTPPTPSGAPNLTYLSSAVEMIGKHLGDRFTVVVNKSTVPIGSGNWVSTLLRDAQSSEGASGARFAVASNPEFLREGNAISDSLYPDRIVVGSDDSLALEVLYSMYRPILDQTFQAPSYLPRPDGLAGVPLLSTGLASAELVKYAANAFLALKISFINEIAGLSERVGADIRQVARGIGLDSRIGARFLNAGLGWGGSCFGKDTAALCSTAAEYGLQMPIVDAARRVNTWQRDRVVERLLNQVKILKGRTIGLLGLAFKPGTDDLRDSPAIDIAQRLIDRGARVKAHDPIAMSRFANEYGSLKVQLCGQPEDVACGADAIILATEWPEYRHIDWAVMAARARTPFFIDGRHALEPAKLQDAGFTYSALH